MRLLLVEDDTMIGETVQDLLRAEHYAVDWAQDAGSADAALRTQQYDLILLDLACPGAMACRCCAICAPAATARRC